jgi:GH18 family chitinase
MKRSLLPILGSLLVSCSHCFAAPKVVAYIPNWIDLNEFSKTIDFAKLTHINIAFENPINDEGDLSFTAGNAVLIEKARAIKVKVLLSIGGGSASGDPKLQQRYYRLLSEPKRAAFAKKLAEVIEKHQLDGLDVDIEGPSVNQDYGPFIDELGALFKTNGKLLTAALSKGYGGDHVPDSVFEQFDFVNIMAYDGAGYWAPNAPGQHSSFAFAKDNVAYWLKRGLPRTKAVLGVPFYGYGFGDAFRKRDYPYRAILESFPEADQKDQAGSTIYYNGIPTIQAKTKYVLDEKLAGVMIWSLDSDAKGSKSLLSAMDDALHGSTK